jgi:hypothetical protein
VFFLCIVEHNFREWRLVPPDFDELHNAISLTYGEILPREKHYLEGGDEDKNDGKSSPLLQMLGKDGNTIDGEHSSTL